jgi:asparagine synthetase A
MDIRVDKDSLLKQLQHRRVSHEADYALQKDLIQGKLPISYGG